MSFLRQHSASVFWSLALHVAIVAVLSFGLDFAPRRAPLAAQQIAIEATVVDQALIERELERIAALERAEIERREQEEREAREAAEATQRAREEEQQRLEEARLAREQAEREERERQVQLQREREREAAEQRQREAEAVAERERLAELQRQREAEEQRQREAERQRQAEEERLARLREEEERRQREEQERRRREEEARRQAEARQQAELEAELARVLAAEEERREAERSGLLAEYVRMIENRIQQNWNQPVSARPGLECLVNVTQIPSGDVVDVRVGRCNGDDAVIRSIEAAVLRASPLPRPPVPALFERNLVVTFRPDI